MDKKTLRKNHSTRGVMLECPKCGHSWFPGHFSWASYDCDNCDKTIEKTSWYVWDFKKGDLVEFNSENIVDKPKKISQGKVTQVFKDDLQVDCGIDGVFYVMKFACKKSVPE